MDLPSDQMSKKTSQNNETGIFQYEDTAFNSQHFPQQAPRKEQGFLRKMLTKGQHFSFSHTTDTILIPGMDTLTPDLMAQIEASESKWTYWNAQRLIGESVTGWSQLYMGIVSLAKICLLGFLPLLYAVMLGALIFGEGGIVVGWNDGISEAVYDYTLYGTLPCLIIYGHYLLLHAGFMFLAPFLRPTLVFEMSRTTGMVTLFKRNKPRFSHPFIEFDCVLMSSPSHQGFLSYSLVLIHRYENYSVGVPISTSMAPNGSVVEYRRLWNMIQRYMDVSQPLPDIIVLEPSRQQDPTTIAYDKEHNRDPRYWRDMTEEQFTRRLKILKSEQASLPATGRSINIFNDVTIKKKSNKKRKKK